MSEQLFDKKYTRQEMIARVLEERKIKAEKADYKIKWAANIYGDHVLTNEKGIRYKIFLRDFENETGYSDSADAAYNKLGTTKHIMYAFAQFKEKSKNKKWLARFDKTFPFIEVYCNPVNDYKITYTYPLEMSAPEKSLIEKYFHGKNYIEDSQVKNFLSFINKAAEFESICIRPEVRKKVENCYEDVLLQKLREKTRVDFSLIKTELFPYQKDGVNFALFRRAAIIADEMGLGKTIQAIGCAVYKKQILGFTKTLVVCPATLKAQWKKEIETRTNETALIISGRRTERAKQYKSNDSYFFIVNYETVLRDSTLINEGGFDLLILDEAQKIKNYETKTASAVKRLAAKHYLVLTGTPIENKLIDIYSIINTISPRFLGPLWEFSYQYCIFDGEKPNKINGYYNLNDLNKKLEEILLRREKAEVLDQLPEVQQRDVYVELSPLQSEYHAGYMKGISQIIKKKFLTPFDLQRLTMFLTNARMVCDSTYLIDDTTNESPKMDVLKEILFDNLSIKTKLRKIIIFSEWKKVHFLISSMLKENKIDFVFLSGDTPVEQRGALIKKFEEDRNCKVFLSTEAGGAGLNLQAADILFNFELPWNPAKKNQRIGRINRLGQQSNKLLIYNFISRCSIEQSIAAGIMVKQNLFDSVLCEGEDYVDFSSRGRSQFIEQIELMIEAQNKFQDVPLEQESIDLPVSEPTNVSAVASTDAAVKSAEMESVLNSGLQFLSCLLKLSTGKELNAQNQKIEVDKETGEIVLRFKL